MNNYLADNNKGVEYILLGMTQYPSQSLDRFVAEDLQELLFPSNPERSKGVTADLIAKNIQRGRDHGLPSYMELRDFCGMEVTCSWSEPPSEITREDWHLLSTIYDDPYDIDLYSGQLLEKPWGKSVVGKTTVCILGKEDYGVSCLKRPPSL